MGGDIEKQIKTWYEIRTISSDGLIKTPQTHGYGQSYDLFAGCYDSPAAVDEAILKYGETYTDYVMLTMKKVEEVDEDE